MHDENTEQRSIKYFHYFNTGLMPPILRGIIT